MTTFSKVTLIAISPDTLADGEIYTHHMAYCDYLREELMDEYTEDGDGAELLEEDDEEDCDNPLNSWPWVDEG